MLAAVRESATWSARPRLSHPSSSPIPSLCGSSSSRLLRPNPVSSSSNLFINATWSSNRAEGLAKAVSVLALGLGVIALAASSSLRTRALAKSAMAELLVGGVFLLIEIFSDQTITSFINNQAPRFASFSPGAALRSWLFSGAFVLGPRGPFAQFRKSCFTCNNSLID